MCHAAEFGNELAWLEEGKDVAGDEGASEGPLKDHLAKWKTELE